VEVRDAVAGLLDEGDRIAAAHDAVARIEGEVNERRIGGVQERGDLLRPLDVRRSVRMERHGDPGCPRTFGSPLDTLGRGFQLIAGERGRRARVRPSRHPQTRFVLVGRKDDGASRTGRGEHCDRAVDEIEVLAEAVLVGDPDRRERAHQLEAVGLERRKHSLRPVTEVARWAELDARVPELLHGAQHQVGRDQVVAVDGPLPHAPRARRAREPSDHRNLLSARRAVS
jgi:hypothetical protein